MKDGLNIEEIKRNEREPLFPLRAEVWRGAATEAQFCERNRRLYSHPFGKSRITTYALKDSGKTVSSMDILNIKVLLRLDDKVEAKDSFLLANFVTPKELRGKGYGKTLLQEYFGSFRQDTGILFSDIGPSLYSIYGFTDRRVFVVEGQSGKYAGIEAVPISLKDFAEGLSALREKDLLTHVPGSLCVAPDESYLDWRLESYRFFSEVFNKTFPAATAFKLTHEHAEHMVLTAPNALKNRQDGLWVTSGCVWCEKFLAGEAEHNRLPSYAYWDVLPPMKVNEKECPMARSTVSNSLFVDPQLCDWW